MDERRAFRMVELATSMEVDLVFHAFMLLSVIYAVRLMRQGFFVWSFEWRLVGKPCLTRVGFYC